MAYNVKQVATYVSIFVKYMFIPDQENYTVCVYLN